MQPFFEWLNSSSMALAITNSPWIYAVVQSLHLVTLAIFAGAILIVDLRLLGRGFKQQPLKQVAQDAQPWLIAGFLGMFATGIPQLVGGALKEYNSPIFWIKMEVLLVATIFTFTLRRKVTQTDEARIGPVWGKVVGLVSIALWVGVAVPARLIGLF